MKLSTVWCRLAPLIAVFAIHAAAHAGAGTLTANVVRLQDSVTYANPNSMPPLATFVGYQVTVTNTGRNTINNIRFTGASSVTAAGESAPVVSVDGAACSVNGSAIDCPIGQLKSGQSSPTFAVFFSAPVRAAGSTVPNGVDGSCATTDCVAFAGALVYAETTGGPKSIPDNSIVPWAPVYVPVGTSNPQFVSTAVLKAGGTLFTGQGGKATTTDPFATTVVVPPIPNFTTAKINEKERLTPAVCVNLGVLPACYKSDITVPGTFSPYLQVVLQLDGSAAPRGTRIESILITYDDVPVGLCASPTTPRTDGIPCIAARRTIATAPVASPTVSTSRDDDDDAYSCRGQTFEWTLINTRNGSLKVF